ncbi:MAG: aldehyde dehydrogenase [Alphaproteobacteria bacterium]|jgi:gamma-glutamyl-gamma-aminobutyraldehyde dehydrogenase|nr:aldehyde dehydrogenase [Alphaproteobacteria bacterium]
MLDRPTTKDQWIARARATTPDGRAFINGAYVNAKSGKTFDKISSADGSVAGQVADCDAADIDLAVSAAKTAFEDGRWRDKPATEKKRVLLRFAELIKQHTDEIAIRETLDVGKVISNSISIDVPYCYVCLQYYAELADKMYDEIAPMSPNDLVQIRKEPLGVIGAIVPWNYPLIISAWKLGPALLAGNSVVLKPAEQSPFASLYLGGLAREAGIPDGVLNIVPGFGEKTGKPLALHMDVDMVTFTGSTEVGKLMMRYAADSNIKRVALELGGKSAQIVMPDADLDAAAEAIAWSIYYNQGQTCHAGSRVLAHRSIRKQLIEKIIKVTAAQIPQGHSFDPAAQMGAMVEQKHMERVLEYIAVGQKEGASLALGGKQIMQNTGGFYVEPTIFDEVKPDMRIAQEEIFGPVLAVIPFDTEEEAVRIANGTVFGLGGSVWTSDMNVAHRVSGAIRAGTVWVNCYDKSSPVTPFGGFKQSGFGRDRSPHAVDKYMDYKTIWTVYK